MKNLLTLITVFALSASSVQAQFATIWSKNSGSINADYMGKVVSDGTSSYFISSFSSTYNLDNNTQISSKGMNDVVLTKIDANGDIIWAKSFGSEGNDNGYDLSLDNDGNLVIVGSFTDEIDFGNEQKLISNGDLDAFVVKFDSDGDAIWSINAGGSAKDEATAVTIDTDGNMYIGGSVSSIDGFIGANSIISLGGSDMFTAKISSSGSVLWANTFGDIDNEMMSDLAINSKGELLVNLSLENDIIIGNDTLDIDLGLGLNLKYSANGNLNWMQQNAAANNMMDGAVTFDNEDNFYTTGTFSGTVKFGENELVSRGETDVFVMKQDASGDIVWIKQFGGTGADGANDILIHNSQVFIAGYFESTADFGSNTLSSNGMKDNFIASYSLSGSVITAISSGGSGTDMVNCLAVYSNNQIMASGTFEGTGTFKKETNTSNGESDHYVWMMKNEPVSINSYKTNNQISLYPNPANQKVYINTLNNSTAHFVIKSINGQQLMNTVVNGENTEVQLNMLSPGLYIAELIYDNNQTQRTRLVIR